MQQVLVREWNLFFSRDAEHLSVADKSAFADISQWDYIHGHINTTSNSLTVFLYRILPGEMEKDFALHHTNDSARLSPALG